MLPVSSINWPLSGTSSCPLETKALRLTYGERNIVPSFIATTKKRIDGYEVWYAALSPYLFHFKYLGPSFPHQRLNNQTKSPKGDPAGFHAIKGQAHPVLCSVGLGEIPTVRLILKFTSLLTVRRALRRHGGKRIDFKRPFGGKPM